MPPYLPRLLDRELDELIAGLPAIAIEGPKGIGKTATAARRAARVVRLDDPAVRQVAASDPGALLGPPYPVLLDEWQFVPAIWDAVRRAVDDDPRAGRFLLTGSASPAEPTMHSGAGRIVRVRMRPLSLTERGLDEPTVSLQALLSGARQPLSGRTELRVADYAREIVASGLPGLRGLSGRTLRTALDGWIARILDHDIEIDGGLRVRRPESMRRWLTAYAAATATTASLATIRAAASGGDGVVASHVTMLAWRDVLARLWLLDPIDGWVPTRDRIARVAQAPKHHLADPALAARLLGVDADALLGGITAHAASAGAATPAVRDGPLLGQLFESLVSSSVRAMAQLAEARVFHLRNGDGRHEVDLIVERSDGRVLAIEVKLAATVDDRDVRHLHWLRDRIGDDLLDAIVVTTGPYAYRREDGIGVVPAVLLGA